MLTSLAYIFLLGLLLGWVFQKIKLPSLLGMLLSGILLGPSFFNLLDSSILSISADLRQLALVIILTRAGLSLRLEDLKKVGRPAFLMCFVPASFEIIAISIFAPLLFGISTLEAAILGSVLAAVSPAIIVPRMIRLIHEGYGTKKSIPQLVLAGASVDDVFVIVLFTSFVALASGKGIEAQNFINIPISILLGIAFGAICGYLLSRFFQKFHTRDSVKVINLLSLSFLMIALEQAIKGFIPFSGLLAIMSMGIALNKFNSETAELLSVKYNKLWVAAEVILFVLVGAIVDLNYAMSAGFTAVLLIFAALIVRMIGVAFCLIKTNFTVKERIFTMLSYTPKATVQAAIGSIPLSMGLPCGQLVLTVAVLSILLTAPIGAFSIDATYTRLLTKENQSCDLSSHNARMLSKNNFAAGAKTASSKSK
ncbi:cation:proton antiporter [Anaerovorax sp. IOR16]|uniref:cation:proton antiporter n=1 Tax=Anaerovorax sp. IOR16 TaxID=2773458 RepID=UPI0019D15B17|nr:cation:proton antiporter [Anaerovorax sp. IOR16]